MSLRGTKFKVNIHIDKAKKGIIISRGVSPNSKAALNRGRPVQ